MTDISEPPSTSPLTLIKPPIDESLLALVAWRSPTPYTDAIPPIQAFDAVEIKDPAVMSQKRLSRVPKRASLRTDKGPEHRLFPETERSDPTANLPSIASVFEKKAADSNIDAASDGVATFPEIERDLPTIAEETIERDPDIASPDIEVHVPISADPFVLKPPSWAPPCTENDEPICKLDEKEEDFPHTHGPRIERKSCPQNAPRAERLEPVKIDP